MITNSTRRGGKLSNGGKRVRPKRTGAASSAPTKSKAERDGEMGKRRGEQRGEVTGPTRKGDVLGTPGERSKN